RRHRHHVLLAPVGGAGGRFRRLWTGSFEDEHRRTPRQKFALTVMSLLPIRTCEKLYYIALSNV
ncbi:MAG: hypothetical protein II629_07255, partial [Ruminococcus sp.]|nr:hypothetical protein [Ruminococcus sp.]